MFPCWILLLLYGLLPIAYSAPHSVAQKTAAIIFIGDASLMEEALTERLVGCLTHADSVRRKNIVGSGYNFDNRMQGRITSKHISGKNYFAEVSGLHVASDNKLPSGFANNMYDRAMPASSYDNGGASINSGDFHSEVSSGDFSGMLPNANGGPIGVMSSGVHTDTSTQAYEGILERKYQAPVNDAKGSNSFPSFSKHNPFPGKNYKGVHHVPWGDLGKHEQHSSSEGITGALKNGKGDAFPFDKNVKVFDGGFGDGRFDVEHTNTLALSEGNKINLLHSIAASGKTEELIEHLIERLKNCKGSGRTDSLGMRREDSDDFGVNVDHTTGEKGTGLLDGLVDSLLGNVGLLGSLLSGLLGGGGGDDTIGVIQGRISDDTFSGKTIKGGRFNSRSFGADNSFHGSLDSRTAGKYENSLPSGNMLGSTLLNGESHSSNSLHGSVVGDKGSIFESVPTNVPVGGHKINEEGSLIGGSIGSHDRADMLVGGSGNEKRVSVIGSKVNGIHGSFGGFVGGTVNDVATGVTSGDLLGGSISGSILDGGIIGSTSGGLANGILQSVLGKDGLLKSIVGLNGLAGDLLDAILGKLLSIGGLTSILGNDGNLGMIEGIGLKITHLDMPTVSMEMLQPLGLKLSLRTKVHVSADSLMGDILDCTATVNLTATAQLTSDHDGSPRLIIQHCDSTIHNLVIKLSNGAFDGVQDSIQNLLNIALPAVVCPIADVLMGLVSAGLSSVNTVAPLGDDGSLQYAVCNLPVIKESNFEIDLNTVVKKDPASSLPVIEVNKAMQLPPKQQGTSQLAIHHDFLKNTVNLLLSTMNLEIGITEKDGAKLSSSLLNKIIPKVQSFYPTPEDMMVRIKLSAAPTIVFENKKPMIKVSARTEVFVSSSAGLPQSLFALDTHITFRVLLVPGEHHLRMSVSPKSVTMKNLTSNIGSFEVESIKEFIAEMVRHGVVGPMNVALKDGIAMPPLFNLNFANAEISYLEDNIVLTVPTPHVGHDCHRE